jgi:hypothetical protein
VKTLGVPSLSTARTRSSNKSIIQLYKTDLKPLLANFGTNMRAKSKALIDEIDNIFAECFDLNQKEEEFIRKFDIEFRIENPESKE